VVERKSRFGDWEGDTVIGAEHRGVLVTLVERKSKYTAIKKIDNKTAELTQKALIDLQQDSPIYFAKPYRSWERGLNENTNGLIRQYIPKKDPFDHLDDSYIRMVEDRLNNRPRKDLGYLTPTEYINKYFMQKFVAIEI